LATRFADTFEDHILYDIPFDGDWSDIFDALDGVTEVADEVSMLRYEEFVVAFFVIGLEAAEYRFALKLRSISIKSRLVHVDFLFDIFKGDGLCLFVKHLQKLSSSGG
jgi:hypothetical protein